MPPRVQGTASEQPNVPLGARSGKRKYTSKACEECRRRRAKCDGKKPACSRCTDRGIECRFRFEEDGRRPAPKSYVQLLRNRIEVLERILQSHGIDVDTTVAQAIAEDNFHPATLGDDPLAGLSSGAGSSSSQFEELCAAFEGALALDESLNFDQDGEVRYFGPTSGRLEFQTTAPSPSCSAPEAQCAETPRTIQSRIQVNRSQQASEEGLDLPEGLKAELIDLYFTWEQPWFQVVNEDLFRESERCNGRYCSPLLLNCILAIGSRFSDRTEVRDDLDDPNTAGKLFLERAEALLSYDLRFPSITTIQSLCLIGTIYFAFGTDAAGWLHHGMAHRLALDMGLNLDSASLAGSHLMPAEEIDLRRQIYWALYNHDKLAATYTGRVCTMLSSQGAVNMPSNSRPDQTALILLCQICEKIILNLYAPKPLLSGTQRYPFLSSCILELRSWLYDLPSEMRLDRPPGNEIPPQAYTTHMVYHTSIILLMKPFLAQPGQKSTHPHADCLAKKAAVSCYESSRQIVLVGRKYRQVFGSFRRSPITATHCTLSAALVLVRIAKTSGGRRTGKDLRMIEDCLQVLDELSTSWNIARRIRQSLVRLHEQLRDTAEREDAGTQTSDPGLSTEVPMFFEPHEGLVQDFSGGISSGAMGGTSLGEFSDNMLLDDFLWTNAGLDFTFDPILSESFDALGHW